MLELNKELTKSFAFKDAERFRSYVWINIHAKHGKVKVVPNHMARSLQVPPSLIRRHVSELVKRGLMTKKSVYGGLYIELAGPVVKKISRRKKAQRKTEVTK